MMKHVDEYETENDRDDPLPEDIADGDAPAMVECPSCFRMILDDTDICPGCGQFICHEDAPPPRRPFWAVVGVVTAGLVIVAWIWR